jgi:hypothetical protein
MRWALGAGTAYVALIVALVLAGFVYQVAGGVAVGIYAVVIVAAAATLIRRRRNRG